MNSKTLTAFALLVFIFSQGFQCGGGALNNCVVHNEDSVALNVSVANSNSVYHLNDTIWINSSVSDNFSTLSGSGSLTTELNQLYLTVQPFQVINSTSLPQLQFANIEFNPVVNEGMLQYGIYNTGYVFLYRRTTALNTLKIGFVAGRTGLYVISAYNGKYISDGSFTLIKGTDYCTLYPGITTFPPAEQNKNYWDTLGVTTVSLPPNYGYKVISKSMHSYFFFRVIP